MKKVNFSWLKKFLTFTKYELKKLLTDKSTWILLAIFVSIINTCAFFLGGFLVLNEASMISFLRFAPYCIVIFALLLSFSKNIKDYKKPNFIKTASLPIGMKTITLAKYTANCIVGALFVILSLSFAGTLFYIGNPDILLVFSGIFACVLLFKLAFAVTLFTNNIAKSSFESLGYSILILFILFLSGLGGLSTILASFLPSEIVIQLTKYSVVDSFYNIGSGFIGFNDFILFVSLIVFFLTGALIYANKEIYKSKSSKFIILGMICLTIFVNNNFYRSTLKLDLTSDKIYSISTNLQKLIANLNDDKVIVTFYYSESNPNKPLEYSKFADYIDKYLKQLESISEGNIVYKKLDPEKSEDYEVQALRDRIAEIPLPNGDSMYAGISFRRNVLLESMPYIKLNRKHFFEYDIASNISKFTRINNIKKIGIITDLDLGKDEQRPAFMLELLKRYDVDVIPIGYPTFPNYDLIITFVTPFTELETIYGVDQYLVNGGKVLVFLDPLFRTAPEDDFFMPDRKADDSAFDHIADLLRFYGVDYDYNAILGDKGRAMSTNIPKIGVTSYPLWVMFSEREMNKANPIFANLNNIVIPEGGFFTKKETLPSLNYQDLLVSSESSQEVSRALFSTLRDPKAIAARLRGDQKSRTVAFMLDGNFTSAFKGMPSSVSNWFSEAQSIEGSAQYPKHINVSDKKGVIIGVADMDFMSDQFSTYGKKELDGSLTRTPISDNQAFLTNMIDYLMAENDLMGLRGKGSSLRTLTKIEDLLVKDILRRDFQENALVRNIEIVSGQYASLRKRLNIAKTEEQVQQINQLLSEKQKDMVVSKRELKTYKRSLKEMVENYARKVALFNILFAPIILGLIGFLYFYRRKSFSKKHN